MKPTLILVAGAARSGTTLLDAMLGSNEHSFSCGEPFAWFRPFEPKHTVLSCSCGANRCPTWETIVPGPEETFHVRAMDRLGVSVLVDSSKDLRWMADSLERAKANRLRARVVLIWKDPVELAHSWRKRGHLASRFGTGDSGRKVRRQLGAFINYHRELLTLTRDVVSVPYRSLADSPGAALKSVAKALDVPYVPGQEKFWRRPLHILFGSASIRRALIDPAPRIERSPSLARESSSNNLVRQIAESSSDLEDLLRELRRRSVA